MTVAEDLHFNVTGCLEELFNQHVVIAKTGEGLPFRGCQRLREFGGAVHLAHALAAATSDGFQQHRIAHGVGGFKQQCQILVVTVITGQQRNTSLFHGLLRCGL